MFIHDLTEYKLHKLSGQPNIIMLELSKCRSHSRSVNLVMKHLLDENAPQTIETSSGSDEAIELNADLASISLSLKDSDSK